MTRALLMMVWGWTLIWSWGSGRLDLLLRGVFHGLVGAAGLVMLALGVLLLIQRRAQRDRLSWQAIASASMAVTILVLPHNRPSVTWPAIGRKDYRRHRNWLLFCHRNSAP